MYSTLCMHGDQMNETKPLTIRNLLHKACATTKRRSNLDESWEQL